MKNLLSELVRDAKRAEETEAEHHFTQSYQVIYKDGLVQSDLQAHSCSSGMVFS